MDVLGEVIPHFGIAKLAGKAGLLLFQAIKENRTHSLGENASIYRAAAQQNYGIDHAAIYNKLGDHVKETEIIGQVYEILRKGSEVARAEAAKTLADVRKAMKIDYFEDADLIAEHTKKYQK